MADTRETNHQRYFGSPSKVARTIIENQEGTEHIIVWHKPEGGKAWEWVVELTSRADFLAWLEEEAVCEPCKYCDGSQREMPLDEFASTYEYDSPVARMEGVDEAYPAIWVKADGADVYVRAKHCPHCGRKLGEAAKSA